MGQNLGSELSKEDLRDLCFSLLREWWLAATQALVDEAGSEAALRHLKPYFTNTGMAGAHNIPDIQGITLDELLDRGALCYMWLLITGARSGAIFKADDESRIFEIVDCATGGISKEGCISLCQFTNNAGVGVGRQDFEAILLRSLSFGDSVCHLAFRRVGIEAKVSAIDEFRVPEDKWPVLPDEELKEYLALSLIGEAWSNATRALIDFAGPERALDRLRFHMRHAGLSFGIRMADRLGARERRLQSILEIVELVQLLHRRKGTCTVGEGCAEGKVSECPFSSSPSEICMQYEAFFNGVCEAIDPSCEFAYDRMMTKGDKTCHWLITKKGQTASKADAVPEDPIKVLKLRYAKGEITREEYQRMKEELLE